MKKRGVVNKKSIYGERERELKAKMRNYSIKNLNLLLEVLCGKTIKSNS